MNQYTRSIVDDLPAASTEAKESGLSDLNDFIQMGHPSQDDLVEVVQLMISMLLHEQEKRVETLLFRNLTAAYMQPADLSGINYETLIGRCETAPPLFISGVIYILSMTWQKKYIPVITKYLDHPDAGVRKEALDALDYIDRV